jgi:uncharacterized membrane protein
MIASLMCLPNTRCTRLAGTWRRKVDMPWLIIGILVLIVILFGISSSAQSYATAQQAQAQIEVAQLGQINAWGNLVVILAIVVLVGLIVALVAILVWARYTRAQLQQRPTRTNLPAAETKAPRELTIDDLLKLETLRYMRESRQPSAPALPERSSRDPDEDIPSWLQ